MNAPAARTRLVLLEGVDGTGKTTVARSIAQRNPFFRMLVSPSPEARKMVRLVYERRVPPEDRMRLYLAVNAYVSRQARRTLATQSVVQDRKLPRNNREPQRGDENGLYALFRNAG